MDRRHSEIFGRRPELDAIDRLLDHDGSGAAALLLDGDAGIGKTTIWQAGVDKARRRGLTTLVARPAEGEISLPFGALGDLLDPVVDTLVAELPAPQREALDQALQRTDAAEPASRLAVSRAVLGLLRALAEAGPVLVAIDDVQWLDAPTEHVLTFSLRRLVDLRARLLIARRSVGELPAPLGLDLASFVVARSRVDVLPPAELGALLDERLALNLPRPRLLELHRVSGGNPFYALEIGGALLRPHDGADDGHLPVPENLGELLRLRLDALSAEGRDVTLLAAASPQPTSTLIERAARGTGGLAEAVAAAVLQTDPDRIRFSHPLLASVAYNSATPWDRRAAHERLARVATDLVERASHLALATDQPDDHIAAELADAAGQAAARGAPETAAAFMERSAALTPVGAVEARNRLSAAVEHHIAAGDTARARGILEQLVADLPPGPERADLLRRLGDVGDSHLESISLCERALEEAGGAPTVSAAAHIQLAILTGVAGDLPRSIEHTRAASRFAEEAGDERLVAITIADLCYRLTYLGLQYPEEEMARALELEQRLDGFPAFQNPSYVLGLILTYTDSPDAARPLLQAELERLEKAGNASWQIGVLLRLADLELRTGNWSEAARLARGSMSIAQNAGIAQEQSIGLMIHGLVQAHLGNVDEAREAAARALALAEAAGDKGYATRAAGALGFAELSAGNDEVALRYLLPASAVLRRMGVGELSINHVVQNEIDALVALGRLEEAEVTIEYVEEKGRPTQRVWHAAVSARGRALVAAAHGDVETARAHLDRALAAHENLPQPFELGRTLLVLGQVERRAKHRAVARDALTNALEIFDSLGAPRWAEKAAAELARIPGRTRVAGELTETERRVAELVAEGLSNKEVAARLFVSVRAVESNLSKVYAKLGIRSRTQLASRLRA